MRMRGLLGEGDVPVLREGGDDFGQAASWRKKS
jgi:hypothetical protein